MGAIKKGKAVKHLRKGKKMEEQKPLSIAKLVDKSSSILPNVCVTGK
jgi:hypothetical protein